jgi:hypothetical protein
MKRILLTAAVLVMAASTAMAATQCKDPKTGKFVKCPPPAASSAPASSGAPHCTTGKPCGHTCIAKNKTCHKT